MHSMGAPGRSEAYPSADERATRLCGRAPPIGAKDHVTGEGVEARSSTRTSGFYRAAGWARLRELPVRLCFSTLPDGVLKHPRAPALYAAAEAAGAQGAFWEMCDSLYTDRTRTTRISGSGRSASSA